jgi:hypothetical protein
MIGNTTVHAKIIIEGIKFDVLYEPFKSVIKYVSE